ncbi:uncharacterized protein Dwil_GK27220 [Drosophila willistoni]|uniref:Uncharacterized protein n=1 Tax=Drosophila willistoni TaxID=7260 RepID=A0A0Q9X3R6_DROWI|nr:uncharacterized protein Dwil_GK27220 [Drosophila willistoni]
MSSGQLKGLFLIFSLLALILSMALETNATPAWQRSYQPERSGRSYTDIARVINPNPYAFVGARNYPGQPFWPAGRR